jgi:uncharacterized protein
MASNVPLTITLVYSPQARVVREIALTVPVECTVGQAVQASGVLAGLSRDEVDQLEVGIWGRKVALSHGLRAHDRIELYRPLRVDPKVARRERFARQGVKAKSAGLFAKRRQGAKAGY